MTRLPTLLRVLSTLALSVLSASPAVAAPQTSSPPNDGLTRDAFVDSAPQASAAATAPTRSGSKRTRLDSKDFLSVHHIARHHGAARKHNQVAATSRAPRHRGPVVGFVYWWNGWVLKTFHTRVGTVMLGTIGAKS